MPELRRKVRRSITQPVLGALVVAGWVDFFVSFMVPSSSLRHAARVSG
jgi:hypothetical protein